MSIIRELRVFRIAFMYRWSIRLAEFHWVVTEGSNWAVGFVIAVGPETENAASAGPAGLYAFELPLVFATVAVDEVSGLCERIF